MSKLVAPMVLHLDAVPDFTFSWTRDEGESLEVVVPRIATHLPPGAGLTEGELVAVEGGPATGLWVVAEVRPGDRDAHVRFRRRSVEESEEL